VIDEGRHVVQPTYRFEIFRQTYRRFSWRFVVIEVGGRRVLARSHRGYRSPKRVRRAIRTLKQAADALQKAEVVNVCDTDAFPLPATSFQVLYDVVPLMVDEFPVIEDEVPSAQPVGQSLQPVVQQDVVEPEPPEAAAAAKPKPAVRGGPRGKPAT
jgi:hypothetical protein